MNFFKGKQPQQVSPSSAPPPQPERQSPETHFFFQQAFTNLQTHCSNFLQNHHQLLKPHLVSLKTHLENHVKNPNFVRYRAREPLWARITEKAPGSGTVAMSTEAIEERLAGVPVYALSNSSEEFVLVSGVGSGKSLGLFCVKEEDAESLLEHMKSMDPGMREGSKVVAVALNKVFQLKVDGVAFRLIPESSQVKNALKAFNGFGS
ncbi:unnamed protein product [Ilex paraguariensis]|uniref:Protein TIC 22-like, chloroplastic n=2 Tax=Magnoliopsida TaxID=3398 RepID=A0ABC8SA05_9AQUA